MKNPSSSLLHLAISVGLPVLFFCGIALVQTPVVRMTSVPVAVQVRHAPVLNGRVEGSVHQMFGEAVRLNGSASITGDLLVPGTPTVRINGQPTFGGLTHGSGDSQPSGYVVTLNGGSSLGHIVDRTDPVALPAVPSPPLSTGTRSVVINGPGQSVGDWATVRDLTLNGNAGVIAVPPGTYRNFVANGNGFELGVAGSQQVAVYNLQQLTMNGASVLRVVGPVKLVVNSQINMNGTAGSAAVPGWLTVEVAAGGVTLNGGSSLYGAVRAPAGAVTVNGNARLVGSVVADRLTVNGGGVISGAATDTTAPQVVITSPVEGSFTNAPAVVVSGTVTDDYAVTVTLNGAAVALADANFNAEVLLPIDGPNAIALVAIDAAGNQTQLTRTVIRDSVAPSLVLTTPGEGIDIVEPAIQVQGTVEDASSVTVTVNGLQAPVANGAFSLPLTLSDGGNTLEVRAVDDAGNSTLIVRGVEWHADRTPPDLVVDYPRNGDILGPDVTVSGTVSDSSLVSVYINGDWYPVSPNGRFAASVLLPEGSQELRVTARDVNGLTTDRTLNVQVDATEPSFAQVTPEEGSLITGTFTTISGSVSDESPTTVSVNGVSVAVQQGGSFTSGQVAIGEGQNVFAIIAVDAGGNRTSLALTLFGADRTPPSAPVVFPGKSLTRLRFGLVEGRAESGCTVHIAGGVSDARADAAFGSGLFAANIDLRTGDNALSLVAVDAAGNVSTASHVLIVSDPLVLVPPAGAAWQINTAYGNAQRGLPGYELPRPLVARVTDAFGSPVQDQVVRFEVQEGGGHFTDGQTVASAVTDVNGQAQVRYVCGEGVGPQMIRADFDTNSATQATFLAQTLQLSVDGVTSVTGVVLDQNLRALPNALIRIGGQETRTGADGRFSLYEMATGPHQLLEVIGRDQIALPGRWPNISYEFDVFPGVENSLGRPLFLPRVNEGVELPTDPNGLVTQDTTYTLRLPAVEPIRVTARAGTHVTFPPDVTDKRLSVTVIPTNRVPMHLDEGRATSLYVSVQPSGAIFDPPLEISFPNLDGLQAGSEVLIMSFDHDAGRYLKVGSGHVSSDARRVTSDPGDGVHVGAWHALPPDPPAPEATILGNVQVDGNPLFQDQTIEHAEAWVEGTAATLLNPWGGSAASGSGSKLGYVVTSPTGRLDFRATIAVPRNMDPRALSLQSTVDAKHPQVDVSRRQVVLVKGSTVEVSATAIAGVGGNPAFKWNSRNRDLVTVTPVTTAGASSSVVFTGGAEAGRTKVTLEFRNDSNGKFKADIEVLVVKVEYSRAGADCGGFDDTRLEENLPSGSTLAKYDAPWLTVVKGLNSTDPSYGTSTVKAKIIPSEAVGFVTFETDASAAVTVTSDDATQSEQVLSITGRQAGSHKVVARVDGKDGDKLNIAVRNKVIHTVALHLVTDLGGNHHTDVDENEAREFVRRLNETLTPQTGIVWEVSVILNDITPVALGPIVSEHKKVAALFDGDYAVLAAMADPSADKNIFFVWRVERYDTGTHDPDVRGFTVPPGRDIVVENGVDGLIGAHESLHAEELQATDVDAGQAPHSARSLDLFHYNAAEGGCFIPWADAEYIVNTRGY